MTIVKWIPFTGKQNISEDDLLYYEPIPAFKYILSQRDSEKSAYLKCPAVSGYFKNTFVIRAPYDLVIDIDLENKKVSTDRFGQEFYELSVNPDWKSEPLILQICPRYVFLSDSKKPIIMTSLPWFFRSNVNGFIPGSFDITKWIRPITYPQEIYNSQKLVFKRGEPLYFVKFETQDNSTVTLEKELLTDELFLAIDASTNIKFRIPKLSLTYLYDFTAESVKIFKKRIFKSFK